MVLAFPPTIRCDFLSESLLGSVTFYKSNKIRMIFIWYEFNNFIFWFTEYKKDPVVKWYRDDADPLLEK